MADEGCQQAANLPPLYICAYHTNTNALETTNVKATQVRVCTCSSHSGIVQLQKWKQINFIINVLTPHNNKCFNYNQAHTIIRNLLLSNQMIQYVAN